MIHGQQKSSNDPKIVKKSESCSPICGEKCYFHHTTENPRNPKTHHLIFQKIFGTCGFTLFFRSLSSSLTPMALGALRDSSKKAPQQWGFLRTQTQSNTWKTGAERCLPWHVFSTQGFLDPFPAEFFLEPRNKEITTKSVSQFPKPTFN